MNLMDLNYTQGLKRVLTSGHSEAVRHNNSVIMPEHFLLALMKEVDSEPFKLVERVSAGSSAYELQQELDREMFEASLAESGSQGTVSADKVTASDVANRIIRLSVLEARMLKSEVVDRSEERRVGKEC